MKSIRAACVAALCAAAGPAMAQTAYTYVIPAAVVAPMSDEDLRYTVAQAIAADESLRGATITLRVVEGRVVLEGVALSRAQANQARAVAENALPPELIVSRVEVAR